MWKAWDEGGMNSTPHEEHDELTRDTQHDTNVDLLSPVTTGPISPRGRRTGYRDPRIPIGEGGRK